MFDGWREFLVAVPMELIIIVRGSPLDISEFPGSSPLIQVPVLLPWGKKETHRDTE